MIDFDLAVPAENEGVFNDIFQRPKSVEGLISIGIKSDLVASR